MQKIVDGVLQLCPSLLTSGILQGRGEPIFGWEFLLQQQGSISVPLRRTTL